VSQEKLLPCLAVLAPRKKRLTDFLIAPHRADATINSQATGAMSHAFIRALRQDPEQSYKELLNSIRDILENEYSQKPQLSSSHPLGMNPAFHQPNLAQSGSSGHDLSADQSGRHESPFHHVEIINEDNKSAIDAVSGEVSHLYLASLAMMGISKIKTKEHMEPLCNRGIGASRMS